MRTAVRGIGTVVLAILTVLLTAVIAAPAHAALKPAPPVEVGNKVTSDSIEVGGRNVDMGASTVKAIRRAEGRKENRRFGIVGALGPAGFQLVFRYQVDGKRCTHTYAFPEGGNRVSDFETNCPNARTFNGIRPGMSVMKAQAIAAPIGWVNGRYGAWNCPIDQYVLTVAASGHTFVVATADSFDLTAGSRAKIAEVAAYIDSPTTSFYAAGACERM